MVVLILVFLAVPGVSAAKSAWWSLLPPILAIALALLLRISSLPISQTRVSSVTYAHLLHLTRALCTALALLAAHSPRGEVRHNDNETPDERRGLIVSLEPGTDLPLFASEINLEHQELVGIGVVVRLQHTRDAKIHLHEIIERDRAPHIAHHASSSKARAGSLCGTQVCVKPAVRV